MTCNDKTIKELLPLYSEQALSTAETAAVESHIAGCADCRLELALLSEIATDPVPDPGPAFWNALPNKVYAAVQEQKARPRGILFRLKLPLFPVHQWTWAAGVAVVFLAAWIFALSGVGRNLGDADDQELSLGDPAEISASVNVTDLSGSDLDAVNSWAGGELARISKESDAATANSSLLNLPDELYEDLADLDAHEMDRFSGMLTAYEEEG